MEIRKYFKLKDNKNMTNQNLGMQLNWQLRRNLQALNAYIR